MAVVPGSDQYTMPNPPNAPHRHVPQSDQNVTLSADESGAADQTLTTQIQNAVKTAFWGKYKDVSITVNQGNVTLTGTVASQSDKDILEKLISKVPGVQGVTNQLTVKGS
ncbi:BON domain-containing protein [Chlamydiota bacterium]